MFTRALFLQSVRASNFKFKFLVLFWTLCHARSLIYSCFLSTDEEAEASKRMVGYVLFAQLWTFSFVIPVQ